jgi:hypothetical protein
MPEDGYETVSYFKNITVIIHSDFPMFHNMTIGYLMVISMVRGFHTCHGYGSTGNVPSVA